MADDEVYGPIAPTPNDLAVGGVPGDVQNIDDIKNLIASLSGGDKGAIAPSAKDTPQLNPASLNVPTQEGQSANNGLPASLQKIIGAMSTSGMDVSPMVKGGLTRQQAVDRAGMPPKPKIAGLPGLIMDMINPARGTAPGQAVPSKLDHFNDFLTNFMQSLSAGFANEGTGPGSAMRGAAAAMQAPYQSSLQQYGMQQEAAKNQAQIAAEQATTEQKRVQTERMQNSTMLTMPNGTQVMVPNDKVGDVLKSMAPAEARVAAANIAADAKKETQDKVNQTLGEAADLLKKGDVKGYQAKLKQAAEMAVAKKPVAVKNNESEWIDRINRDPTDKVAAANLKTLQDRREALMKQRGMSMGIGRLYGLRNYLNKETGDIESLTGFQYLANKSDYEPAGQISGDKVIAVQQLQSEAAPAIKQMRDSLGAFDNESDKLIFAKIMKGAGAPPAGDEHTWLNNVTNQVLTSNLSQQGKDLMISEARMAETLGRMRGVLGLQATDSAMALTLGLMSGYSTPDSKYAKKQLDTIDDMINRAVEIPALGGRGGIPDRMKKDKGAGGGGGSKSGGAVNKDGFPIIGK